MSFAVWILFTISLYLVVMLYLGWWAARKTGTFEDFLLGGRTIGPWVIGFSERASEMSGWVSIGLTGEGFSGGVAAMWNLIGCYLADFFCWNAIAKRLRTYTEVVNALTIPSFLENRFKDRRGLIRIIGGLIFVVFLTQYVSAQYVAAGKLFDALTPMSFNQATILGAVIIMIYTCAGGFLAVSWTDFLQGIVALFGLTALGLIGLFQFGPVGIFQELGQIDQTLLDPFWGLTGIAAVITALSYVSIGFGWTGNPHIMVRFMGIRSTKDLRKAALIALSLMILVYTSVFIIGMAGKIVAETQGKQLIDPEYIMPTLAKLWFPAPIAGILVAAALSLMMSTADSQLLVAVSALVDDIYHRFINQDATEKQLVLYGRIGTIVLGLAALVLAFGGGKVFTLVLDAWAGLGAAFGPAIILGLWWRRATLAGVIVSLFVGAFTVFFWKIVMAPQFDFWFYNLLVAFPLSFALLVIVSLFTQPPKKEDLDREFSILTAPISDVVPQDDGTSKCEDTSSQYSLRSVTSKTITELDNVKIFAGQMNLQPS